MHSRIALNTRVYLDPPPPHAASMLVTSAGWPQWSQKLHVSFEDLKCDCYRKMENQCSVQYRRPINIPCSPIKLGEAKMHRCFKCSFTTFCFRYKIKVLHFILGHASQLVFILSILRMGEAGQEGTLHNARLGHNWLRFLTSTITKSYPCLKYNTPLPPHMRAHFSNLGSIRYRP